MKVGETLKCKKESIGKLPESDRICRVGNVATRLIGKSSMGMAALSIILALNSLAAYAGDMQLEAVLVWGTNAKTSPDPAHKPVGPEIKKRLQELPLKWTNYFEVNRVKFEVPPAGSNKVPLSEKCAIEVKNPSHEKIEVMVYGKGKQVATRSQDLPKHGTLVLGGDSPGTNCWLAVIKRLN